MVGSAISAAPSRLAAWGCGRGSGAVSTSAEVSLEIGTNALLVDAHRREMLALLLDLCPALLQELGHLEPDA